jgi:dUTP pyrophosphatase
MNNDLKVFFKKVHTDAKTPTYAHSTDAACDLYAAEETVVYSGTHKLIDTGIQIAIPKDFEAQIRPRSGLAYKYRITVLNSPGTIDCSYRGNIKVMLLNLGGVDFEIKKGDRIAQMKFSPVYKGHFIETNNLEETTRGEGGFGSSGRR